MTIILVKQSVGYNRIFEDVKAWGVCLLQAVMVSCP